MAVALDDLRGHLTRGPATLLVGILGTRRSSASSRRFGPRRCCVTCTVIATDVPDSPRAMAAAELAAAWGPRRSLRAVAWTRPWTRPSMAPGRPAGRSSCAARSISSVMSAVGSWEPTHRERPPGPGTAAHRPAHVRLGQPDVHHGHPQRHARFVQRRRARPGTGSRPAVDQALRMVDEGADILDIGGESTRPGHRPVPGQLRNGSAWCRSSRPSAQPCRTCPSASIRPRWTWRWRPSMPARTCSTTWPGSPATGRWRRSPAAWACPMS